VRHPRVAAICVVLDDHEAPARPQVRGERSDDRHLPVPRDVVQAVGRHQAVQKGQIQRPGQVGDQRREIDVGKPRTDGGLVRPQRPRIAIDRRDPAARPEQVGERQRECTLPCSDVGPRPARLDRGPEQPDVIRVVHAASRCSGARRPRR
jgi:hypothetical protein